MLVDLHAKTSRSPGVSLTIDDILDRAVEREMDGVAICDTLSTADAAKWVERGKERGMKVFVGVEINTEQGLLLCFVPKIDGFYLNEEWRSLTAYTVPEAEAVIELFRSHDGAVLAARPYDNRVPYSMGDRIFKLSKIDGVEVFNGRAKNIQCDFALEAARSLGISAFGGSDPAGFKNTIGNAATIFAHDIDGQEDFVKSLCNDPFWAVTLTSVQRSQQSGSGQGSRRPRSPDRSSNGSGKRPPRRDNRK
jgi:predicted metal-dependent phosphoesterase TrpH